MADLYKITEPDLLERMEGNDGFCTDCNEFTTDGVEPDARRYTCPECGNPSVYGTEEALLMGAFILSDEDEIEEDD